MKLMIRVNKEVNVVNAANTAELPLPEGYDSWISYWNDKKGITAKRCRQCKKETSELDGAHVQHVKKNDNGHWQRVDGLFLVPLCSKCNNPNNTKVFSVKRDDLISAL